jgi:broad specificity phosphatase PhoE
MRLIGGEIRAAVMALLLGAGLPLTVGPAEAVDEALWTLLAGGGQVVVIRHAATDMSQRDAVGVPLSDCARQRNLSDDGREDARLIGTAFRTRGVPVGRVLSSDYCRCLDTAQLAFGRLERWLPLRQSLTNAEIQAQRTAEIRALASERPAEGNLVLVTHQFTIRILTGLRIDEGELLILTPRGGGVFDVAGRIPVDELPDP